ncbi:MAG TPA: response regulator [Caulobacteraceae bacterium]|jgi:FixJ family two-component response regulator
MSEEPPTILILVDDDAHVLASLKFAFEVEGFEVHAYCDAESLLAESDFQQRGCLVLDYKLPGINGLQLLKVLRSRGVTLPAVLITTPSPDVLSRAAAAGVPVVDKPLLTNALLETVRRQLERGPKSKG